MLRNITKFAVFCLFVSAGQGTARATEPSKIVQADEGFYVEYPKVVGDKKSVGLEVRYTWGVGGPREAKAIDTGSAWRVRFTDFPEPTELVELELIYLFEPNREDVEAHTTAVVSAVLDEAERAATAVAKENRVALADFSKEFGSQDNAIAEALEPLSKFRTDTKLGAGEEVLASLGVKQKTDGTFELTAAGLTALANASAPLDALGVYAASADATKKRLAGLSPTQCDWKSVSPDDFREERDALKTLVGQCMKQIQTEALAYGQENPQLTGAQKPLSTEWSAAKKAADDLGSLGFEGLDRFQDALGVLHDAFDKLTRTAASGGHPVPTFNALKDADVQATSWLRDSLEVARARRELAKSFPSKAKLETVSLRSVTPGSTLLRLSAERRRWDVATGAVLLHGLNDVAMPTLLAFCPDGCLQDGESIWSETTKPWHGLSIDVGVKASVFDDHVDPRHDGKVMFLTGASTSAPKSVPRFFGGVMEMNCPLRRFGGRERPST